MSSKMAGIVKLKKSGEPKLSGSQSIKRLSTIVLDMNDVPKTWQVLGFNPVPFDTTDIEDEYNAFVDIPDHGRVGFYYNSGGVIGRNMIESNPARGVYEQHKPTAKTLRMMQKRDDGTLRHISGPNDDRFKSTEPEESTGAKKPKKAFTETQGNFFGGFSDEYISEMERLAKKYNLSKSKAKPHPLTAKEIANLEIDLAKVTDKKNDYPTSILKKAVAQMLTAYLAGLSPYLPSYHFTNKNIKMDKDLTNPFEGVFGRLGIGNSVPITFDVGLSEVWKKLASGEVPPHTFNEKNMYKEEEMYKDNPELAAQSKAEREAVQAYISKRSAAAPVLNIPAGAPPAPPAQPDMGVWVFSSLGRWGFEGEQDMRKDEPVADYIKRIKRNRSQRTKKAPAAEPAPEPKKKFVVKKKPAPPLAPIKGKFAPQKEAIPERDEPLTATAVPARKKFVIKKPEPPARPLSEFEKAKKVGWGLIHHIYRFHKITTDYGHFGI